MNMLLHKSKLALAALAMAGAAMPASAGLVINLIDKGGVTGSPAEQGFKIAAKYWERALTNNAVVNFEVSYANLGPGILGGTRSTLVDFVPIAAYYNALAATGNSSLDAKAVANLAPLSATGSVTVKVPEYAHPASFDGVAAAGSRIAPDNTAISSTLALSSANVKALVGGMQNQVDGQIQFSNAFAFDFDPTDGIAAGNYDFIGVAVHEMGHALGYLSGAQDFDYSVGDGFLTDSYWWGYGMDMFRYSAPGVLDWTFGANSYFSIDGGVTPYEGGYFSTGDVHGDGWQASHWKAPNTCFNLLGIMNPYTCGGMTDVVQSLDLAALDAIGWNTAVDVEANPAYGITTAQMYRDYMSAIPEPASLALVMASIGIMGGVMRRRARKAD